MRPEGRLEEALRLCATGRAVGSVFALLLQALNLLAIAIDIRLIALDLLLLPIIGILVPLKLIADQRARA
jgi:TctA family transporter